MHLNLKSKSILATFVFGSFIFFFVLGTSSPAIFPILDGHDQSVLISSEQDQDQYTQEMRNSPTEQVPNSSYNLSTKNTDSPPYATNSVSSLGFTYCTYERN